MLDAAQQQRGGPVPVFVDATAQPALLGSLQSLLPNGLSGVVAPLDVLLALSGGVRGVVQGLTAATADGPTAAVEAAPGEGGMSGIGCLWM